MLGIKTKKAIDDARNILVGKIPSPNTQVEQITIAMLYKFMDDMDQQSKELGGKITFFADDFAQYSWRTIMSKTLGAQERFNRYVEALEKFYSRPKLPQTFKDIFKNATVPYRDADVLTMFLRTIDEGLSYGDSEQLGDAYEYLLMILGSQGDLGQFRTPRHIIDMMVEIVDPQKGDYILDPACGTAGFLISAYKHILKNNMDEKPGDKMNFDERVEVLKHITGYDIEPSMVRIAEMNMFLHGATDPDIHEYDTLTMEDRWEEKFNVILANPPFMTPKGGIKPHKKFGIKANRAEVLFVDYIASHLRAEGRAGIIVPEGILFQSGTAYKELRKNLIENSLIAVISMPSGVFNPYAGVKTSILFLDKKIAKEKQDILFIEMNNDGYSLGTQRNVIAGSELSLIIETIKNYKKGEKYIFANSFTVKKQQLLKENHSLSFNKYKIIEFEDKKYDDPKLIILKLKENNIVYEKILKQLEDISNE
ncbi:MAG: N-6 DNA methylase [Tissierellia bacterium]|nr:N-6 DNA methylase [Tissierellia bacterium]